MARLKMETSAVTTIVSSSGALNSTAGSTTAVVTSGNVTGLSLGQMDCYEDMFKEITKKLYGEDGLAEVIDSTGVPHSNILYDADAFRADASAALAAGAGAGLTLVTSGVNGLPAGTIVVQRRIHDDKGEPITITAPMQHQASAIEERWFDSDELLSWTSSKIARYNPAQKVFRCVDCDFVGFLSRVAEHWLGNHASLRVFQCPRCPYTSAWARCVRMHLTRQHGETLTDNSLWKENPVLEEVTKFLNTLKTTVEQKMESSDPLAKRYTCPFCPYATDRRDLFNRHENIHREEKPFQCYVCEKQFNRADHVKKHFMRMHRDHNYDINRIRKHLPKSHGGAVPFFSNRVNNNNNDCKPQPAPENIICEPDPPAETPEPVALQIQTTNDNNDAVNLQQIPHIAYFNPPITPGQTGPLQGIPGVGGIKKEAKTKGQKKKKGGDKMYSCSYCPWQGVDNWCLKRHLNTHIKPFLCALCDYKAARSERLATHVLKVHNKRVCHKCSFLADDAESLTQHIQDSHQNPLVKTGFNCNVCQEYFELRADLEAHAILEHQKVIVQCDLCDFRTTDEMSMETHLRDKHNLQPGNGAVAAAAAAAAAAAGTPQPQPQQQLQMAPQPVIQLQPLNEQVAVVEHQSDPSLIVPDHMDNSVIDEVAYNEDSTIEKMDQTVPEGEAVSEEEEPETFCEICGYEFVGEDSYKIHEKIHEFRKFKDPYEMKTSKKIARSYGCRTCSYTSCTKYTMMQHLRVHSGFPVSCHAEKCQFASPFENSLKEHIHQQHSDDNSRTSVRCPHCGIKLPSIKGFTMHWRLHHPTLCGLCVNVYKVKFGMKEAGIHDLVSKSPINGDEINNEERTSESDFRLQASGDDGRTQAMVHCINRQNINDVLVTQKNSESLFHTLNGINNNTKKFLSPCQTLKPEEEHNLYPSYTSKKMRFVQYAIPPMNGADVFSNLNSNLTKRNGLRFLPKSMELLVVPLEPSPSDQDNRREERLWRHLCRLSLLKYPFSCYKEPHVLPKHVFNYLTISRNLMNRGGIKCHKFKCRCRRFTRKSTYNVHYLWNHSTKRFKCDICDEKFKHFYQSFLHKVKFHNASPAIVAAAPPNSMHLQIRQGHHSFPPQLNHHSPG